MRVKRSMAYKRGGSHRPNACESLPVAFHFLVNLHCFTPAPAKKVWFRHGFSLLFFLICFANRHPACIPEGFQKLSTYEMITSSLEWRWHANLSSVSLSSISSRKGSLSPLWSDQKHVFAWFVLLVVFKGIDGPFVVCFSCTPGRLVRKFLETMKEWKLDCGLS